MSKYCSWLDHNTYNAITNELSLTVKCYQKLQKHPNKKTVKLYIVTKKYLDIKIVWTPLHYIKCQNTKQAECGTIIFPSFLPVIVLEFKTTKFFLGYK